MTQRKGAARSDWHSPAIEWAVSSAPIDYPDAVRSMQERAARIAAGSAAELVWLLEHPPIYTAGTSARDERAAGARPLSRASDRPRRAPHLPWVRTAHRLRDARLEAPRRRRARLRRARSSNGSSRTLAELGVAGETRADRVGVWVRRPDKGRRRRGQDRRHRTAGDAGGSAFTASASTSIRTYRTTAASYRAASPDMG